MKLLAIRLLTVTVFIYAICILIGASFSPFAWHWAVRIFASVWWMWAANKAFDEFLQEFKR